MPKFLEADLNAEAAKKGFSGRRAARYVYGAMNDRGYMKGNKETAKGEKLQAKHDKDERAGTARDEQHPHKNLGGHLRPSGPTGQPFSASQHPKKGK